MYTGTLTFDALPQAVERLEQSIQQLIQTATMQQRMLAELQRRLSVSIDTEPDKWLNVDELREYLPDHPKTATIYQWVHSRSIPHCKRGKALAFRKSTIDQWLESGRKLTNTEAERLAKNMLTKNTKL